MKANILLLLCVSVAVVAWRQPQPQKRYHYFAYGSNVVPETMTSLRGLKPLNASAAVLPNYRLRFNIRGVPMVEPSAASVEPANNQNVHGVLYQLTEADFAKVGSTEGVPWTYRWQRCEVYPYIGDGLAAGQQAMAISQPVPAYTLIAPGFSKDEDIPPSSSYHGLIVEGSHFWKMDDIYVKFLEQIPTAKNLIPPEGIAKLTLEVAKIVAMVTIIH